MSVIDLQSAKNARNTPDANCVRSDSEGYPVFLFSLHYRVRRQTYTLDIWARSFDDAHEHLAAIRSGVQFDGQVVSSA